MQSQGNKKVLATVGLLVIVAAIGVTVWATRGGEESADTAGSTTPTTTTEQTPAASRSAYKDGSYSANGTYSSPGGRETIEVNLTLKDGKVTDSSVQPDASGPTAQEYQQQFIAGYKSQVTGRSLDEIQLSRVSGSSLTSQGFNAALEQIKSQARG